MKRVRIEKPRPRPRTDADLPPLKPTVRPY